MNVYLEAKTVGRLRRLSAFLTRSTGSPVSLSRLISRAVEEWPPFQKFKDSRSGK
jgi:hypothetical protein